MENVYISHSGENPPIYSDNFIINKELTLVKQDIISIVGDGEEINGIEILSRIGKEQKSPEFYFPDMAEGEKLEFDYKVFSKILEEIDSGKIKQSNIHINIQPYTLTDKDFNIKLENIFTKYNFSNFGRITFEILENGKIENLDILNSNICFLRNKGIKVGLDDFPNDNNNNELLGGIDNLDFVKIDKKFTLSLNNENKEEIISQIQGLVNDIHFFHPGVYIIIEGIENIEAFELIKSRIKGISFFQGYYFGKPSSLYMQ